MPAIGADWRIVFTRLHIGGNAQSRDRIGRSGVDNLVRVYPQFRNSRRINPPQPVGTALLANPEKRLSRAAINASARGHLDDRTRLAGIFAHIHNICYIVDNLTFRYGCNHARFHEFECPH